MKDNLEKVFKEKLDQFEAPYDASAWESMNSRLDAKKGSGGGNTLKWIAASAAVLVVATVASYYFTNNESTKTNQQAEVLEESTVDQSEPEATLNSGKMSENPEETTQEADVEVREDATTETETHVSLDNKETSNKIDQQNKANAEVSIGEGNTENTNSVEDDHLQAVQSKNENNEQPRLNYIAGELLNNQVCKGESIYIRNTGAKDDVMKVQLDGQILTLKKANAHEFTPEHSGNIVFLDGKNEVIDKKEYVVLENPNPEFSYKANIFDKGLPVVECETYGDYETIEWTFDKEFRNKGRKASHHFFKKGDHSVSLTVEDFNGCKNTLTKTVRIDENYNLMAVSAFTPNDNNRLNSTFMPFALTKRDVNFTLTIVDPRDNSVVFTSQDASKGWDGKDARTGEMAPKESIYIWKVQLESDIPNERNVYAGTVQVM